MDQTTWNEWTEKINWILDIAKRKGWESFESVVTKPVSVEEFETLEKELDVKYPDDFKKTLTTFASKLEFGWSLEEAEEEPPEEFREIFGGSLEHLWDFEILKEYYEDNEDLYDENDDFMDEAEKEAMKVYENILPFLVVGNGDVIAFNNNNNVIYVSHSEGELHGKKLGDNFVDFITKWTNLGCVGPAEWSIEPFYDFEKETIPLSSPAINRWKKWLNE